MAKVVRKPGNIKYSRSAIGASMAQVLQHFRKPSVKLDLYVIADRVRGEAARIARNQIGGNDRVVRGYEVQPSSDGFWEVLNTARSDSGRSIGRAWEQGTGIHHRAYRDSTPKGRPIKAKDHGKKVFAFQVPVTDQPKYKSFFYSGQITYGGGRVRRNTKGQIRKRRYNPSGFIYTKEIEGFPGVHALEKAARNLSKIHGWRYIPGVRS